MKIRKNQTTYYDLHSGHGQFCFTHEDISSLKWLRLPLFLMEDGREFHSWQPRNTKEFIPNLTELVWGSCRRLEFRRLQGGNFAMNKHFTISGWEVNILLYTSDKRAFKFLWWMVNESSKSKSSSKERSYLLVVALKARFWTCSFSVSAKTATPV